jgi:hypothetical protein
MSDSPLEHAARVLLSLAAALGASAVLCLVAVWALRRRGLHWSWTAPTLAVADPLWAVDRFAAVAVAMVSAVTTVTGARWHADDLRAGGDLAAQARRRRTPRSAMRSARDRRRIRRGRLISRRGLVVGRDERGRAVHIPTGRTSGRHTLVLGTTGSGKTVTQAWIAGRLIEAG